jgi:adenylate kinase family enzyme
MANTTSVLPMPGQRISIVGGPGCGKTTLSRRLAQLLDCPHIELDALFWGPEWTPAAREIFRRRTARVLAGCSWIVDGNYSVVRDVINARSDTLIWLDYSLPRILTRLLCRTLRRILSREVLWGTNRERLKDQLGRDSLLLYAVRTHGRRRRTYFCLQEHLACSHLAVIRLRNPRETERWLRMASRNCCQTASDPAPDSHGSGGSVAGL